MGILIAQIIALPIGIYSALRQDSWGDLIGRSFAIIFYRRPQFLDSDDGDGLSRNLVGLHATDNVRLVS